MMKEFDLLIIGGGAAGLMAAGLAGQTGARVAVIEHMPRPARKILVTGKGRCNLTNLTDLEGLVAHTPRGGRFLYSAYSAMMPGDVMTLFEQLGVSLKTERGNRVFPQSDRAMDIADALVSHARAGGAQFITGRAKALIVKEGAVAGLTLDNGQTLSAAHVIVATGGLSYPTTGATGDGYRLAAEAGHTIIETAPSLVGLTAHEGFCSELAGLTLKNIALTIVKEGQKKPVYTDFGELLFTHTGISGPMVLSASAHMDKPAAGSYRAVIDFKPALDTEKLENRLLRDWSANPAAPLKGALRSLFPKNLAPVVFSRLSLPNETRCSDVTREQRRQLADLIKAFSVTITGTESIERAVVTRGGVSTREIDPATMQSKICKGLYFAGEVMDLDGYTGGFNLQIAFSTGAAAGRAAALAVKSQK